VLQRRGKGVNRSPAVDAVVVAHPLSQIIERDALRAAPDQLTQSDLPEPLIEQVVGVLAFVGSRRLPVSLPAMRLIDPPRPLRAGVF
jgi:hypothetical protein